MAWTKFNENDCGKVPDDIIYYLVKHVLKYGFKRHFYLPPGVDYEDLFSECLIDAYYYNNVLCRQQYPITVNIGFMKKHIFTRFKNRMIKRFKNSEFENELETEFKDGQAKKESNKLIDYRATISPEQRELLNISKDIYNDWLAQEKNEKKKEALRRYLDGQSIRAIGISMGLKYYQMAEQMIIDSLNQLRIEAIRRSCEKERILNDLRNNVYNGDLVADYIESNSNFNTFARSLKERLKKSVSNTQANQFLKNALNFVRF